MKTNKTKTISEHWASLLAAGSLATLSGLAAESKPETLVPEDAFAVLTIPHFPDARAAFWSDPYVRLFQDAAMENFTKKIQSAWEAVVIRGTEEDWDGSVGRVCSLAKRASHFGAFSGCESGQAPT